MTYKRDGTVVGEMGPNWCTTALQRTKMDENFHTVICCKEISKSLRSYKKKKNAFIFSNK